MTIEQLNALTQAQAEDWFSATNTAKHWCRLMTNARPFKSLKQLKRKAIDEWAKMDVDDLLEAFAGHPMIGDIDSLRAKYEHTKALASDEQSGMQQASEETYESLRDLNQAYLNRHGFIFIVCATGLTAQQMLTKLQNRIDNSTQQERQTAAQEQLKITLLRFDKALRESQ